MSLRSRTPRPPSAPALAVLSVALLSIGGCRQGNSQPPPESKPESRVVPPSPAPESLTRLVRLTPVVDGLDQPLGLVVAPDDDGGRLFVIEKTGRVRILRDGVPPFAVDETPFLDFSTRVSDASEQGLLGLAFHPRFSENGRLFVNFTDLDGETRIVELQVDPANPDRVDPASESELFKLEQPFSNHNAGHLAFGPDGKLHVATGDGGAGNDPQNNAQRDDSLLGKLLRFDVDAEAPKPEVIGKGLRNPWRYDFDRQTGDLYIADVGQNRIEEVNVVASNDITGHNFGWNVLEGTRCLRGSTCRREGMTMPVLEYTHDDGCSITGGHPYRGKALPELAGHYFYSDFCTGLLRSFRWDGKGGVEAHFDWKAALDPGNELKQISAFGEDADGELYVVSLAGNVWRFERN